VLVKSYSADGDFLRLVREARYLTRGRTANVTAQVAATLTRLREMERLVGDRLSLRLENLRMLDVGAGQLHLQMTYFGLHNDVVGIDLDVIVSGLDIRGYMAMLRENGSGRVLKTMGRKLLLVDARYRHELARQLVARELPEAEVIQMDATGMAFQDESFDFVYAFAVFQHVVDPASVLSEMRRVLRPGGGLYVDFILYTSRTGSHDVRLLASKDGDLPLWAHLRPEHSSGVRPNAFVNGLRLEQWRSLIEDLLPGADMVLQQPETEWLEPEARALWKQGELTDYSLEELLTSKVIVLWRKPGP
jgi:SAM-dependent methyltransferase